jgi:Ca-activated chloride channel homolog
MTDLRIDWSDLRVADVYPQRLPDLYVGRPIVVTGRFTRAGQGPVRITGRAGDDRLSLTAPVRLEPSGPALSYAWARRHIAALEDQRTWTTTTSRSRWLVSRIRDTALEFGIMSAYTAFVAVDALTQTEGPYGGTVEVPVPVPEGVSYDTTVRDGQRPRPR